MIYSVDKLNWHKNYMGHGASGVHGFYQIVRRDKTFSLSFRTTYLGEFKNLKAAKTEAQINHENKLLTWLTPVNSVDIEP